MYLPKYTRGGTGGLVLSAVYTCTCRVPRGSSFFLGKVTALGVLCCFALFVCLTLLASFFLPSHLSFKNMYIAGHPKIESYVQNVANSFHTLFDSPIRS